MQRQRTRVRYLQEELQTQSNVWRCSRTLFSSVCIFCSVFLFSSGRHRWCLLACLFACLLVCLLACLLACVRACLRACLLAYWLACVLAGLLACWLACWLACLRAYLRACLLACLRLAALLASVLAHSHQQKTWKANCRKKGKPETSGNDSFTYDDPGRSRGCLFPQ